MSNKPKFTPRVLPPVPTHKIELCQYREFTWRERLQILIGYRLVCDIVVLTSHSPGRCLQKVDMRTTKIIVGQPMSQEQFIEPV